MLVTQSYLTLCDPMDCSPPGSSVHEFFQARILEWVAISFSRGSSQTRDRTWVSCTAGRFFTHWATREAQSESEVAQLCPTLCNPMDCSPPGSFIHGIFQARVLEWVAKRLYVLHNVKNRTTIWFKILTSAYLPKRIEIKISVRY